MELTAHILAYLDRGHGKGLVRPLGLYLKGFGGVKLAVQILPAGGQDGVLVLLTGAGPGQPHDSKDFFHGLPGPVHVAVRIHGLHIGGGLAGIYPELAQAV